MTRGEIATIAVARIAAATDAGLTPEEVAARCRIHPATVRDVLCQRTRALRGPRRVTRGDLMRVLGTNLPGEVT